MGESHIDFPTHCVILTERTWSRTPRTLLFAPFSVFDKTDSFPKKTLNVFWIKKANCIFEELAYLYLIVLLTSFFPLLLRITQKKEPNRRNYLFELQNHAEHNTRNIQTAPYYSSATAIMLAIFWTERDFWIISDYRNSFNNKLKNLWTIKKLL